MASTGLARSLLVSVLVSMFMSVPAAPLIEGQQQPQDFTQSPPDWTTSFFSLFPQSFTTDVPVFEQTTSQSWPSFTDATSFNTATDVTTGRLDPPVDREQELQLIKDTMVAGVTAIRDSLVHLITFVMGGANSIIEQQVGKVSAAVQHVASHSAAIKDSILAAGSGIAQTFGQSLGQTHNITHQLVASIMDIHGHRQPQTGYAKP